MLCSTYTFIELPIFSRIAASTLNALREIADNADINWRWINGARRPARYEYFLEVLDQPPKGEGFERLMIASKLWDK